MALQPGETILRTGGKILPDGKLFQPSRQDIQRRGLFSLAQCGIATMTTDARLIFIK